LKVDFQAMSAAASNGIAFDFNEDRHEYTANGEVVPSVTQILTEMGYSNYSELQAMMPAVLERKRQLGKLVHQAIHFYNENDLDEETQVKPYPIIEARLNGYKAFEAATGYKPLVNEGRQIAEAYGMKFAMCFDSIGLCHGKPPYWLVDIKNASGQPQRSWAIQTAAYALGQKFLPKIPYRALTRVIVQLFDDGTFRLFSSNDQNSKIFGRDDAAVWQAALCLAIDKRNYRL